MANSEVYEFILETKLGGQHKEAESFRKFLQQEHPLKVNVQGLDQLKQLDEILAKGSTKLNFGDLSGLKNIEAASRAILDISKSGNSATSAVSKLRAELAGVKKELDAISESSQLLQSFKTINQSRVSPSVVTGSVRRDNRQIQEEAAAKLAVNEFIRDIRQNRTTLADNAGLAGLIKRSGSSDTSFNRFLAGAGRRIDDADQRRLNALNIARNELEHNPLDFLLAKRSGGLEGIEEERNRIAAKQGLAPGSLGNASPSIFDSRRLLTKDAITQLAFGGLSGGLPGIVGGAIGGGLLGGPGVLFGQTVISALLGAGERLAKTFEDCVQAGIVYERSILGISSVLQSNTRVTKPDGSPVPIQDQLKYQEAEATKIQLASRAKLLPLGIAGSTESTLVTGITTGLAQKGIVGNAEEISTLAERIGGEIQAIRPSLLDNAQQLLKDLQDVFSGGPQAKRTTLSQIIRPALGGLENATTGAEAVKATEPLKAFEALKNSDNPIVALNRLQGAIDQLSTSAGDAALKAQTAGIKDLAEALSNPGLRDGVSQLAGFIGFLSGTGKKIEADLIKTGDFFSRPFVGSVSFLQKQFGQKGPDLKSEIDPRVQITSALRGVGFDETSPLLFETEAKQSPAAKIKAIDKLMSELGGKDALKEQLPGLLSLRATAFGGLTDERAKAFGNLSSGAFASTGGLAGNLQEVEARKKVVDELKAELLQQLPGPKRDTIEGQLDKAQLDLSGSRTKVVQSLQSQFSNATQLAQLKASIAGGLGPAGQVQQASAELQSIGAQKEAAQVFIRGMVEQLKEAEPQLKAVLNDLISKAQLQIKGLDASEKIVRANQRSAVIDERLTNINQDTFAGQRAAIPLELEKQLLARQITPDVSKDRKNSQLADVDVKEFGLRLGLVRGLESLRDAQFEEVNRRRELDVELKQNIRALEDLRHSVRSTSNSIANDRIQTGKDIIANGGSYSDVDSDIVPVLLHPELEKQFKLDEALARQKQLRVKNNPFRRAAEFSEQKQALEIAGARTQLSVEQVTRPTRDAAAALSTSVVQAQGQFGKDAPPLVNALAPQSRQFMKGLLPPSQMLDELPFEGRSFGTNMREAAADSIGDARRAARAQEQEFQNSIKQMASDLVNKQSTNQQAGFDYKQFADAVYNGTKAALSGEL